MTVLGLALIVTKADKAAVVSTAVAHRGSGVVVVWLRSMLCPFCRANLQGVHTERLDSHYSEF